MRLQKLLSRETWLTTYQFGNLIKDGLFSLKKFFFTEIFHAPILIVPVAMTGSIVKIRTGKSKILKGVVDKKYPYASN